MPQTGLEVANLLGAATCAALSGDFHAAAARLREAAEGAANGVQAALLRKTAVAIEDLA